VTTEDKVRIFVYENCPTDRWTGPLTILGVFLTLLIPLMTADFHSFLSIGGDRWKDIFFSCAVFFTLLLARSVFLAWKRPSREDLVKQIKSGTVAGNVAKANFYEDSDHQNGVPHSSEHRQDMGDVM
jgi:hypothetical protein